jgi:hypothetical protein
MKQYNGDEIMPFKQTWYIQDHVVKVEFWGVLKIEDVVQSFNVFGQFLNESNAQRVHFVHDWSKLEKFPANFSSIHKAIDLSQNSSLEKLGSVIIYGAQHHLRAVGDLMFQLLHIRIHITEDFESALSFLQKQDPYLKSILDHKISTDVKWHIQGYILYCYNVHTADDIKARNQNALKLIEAEGKPPYVHMLIDFSLPEDPNYSANVRELVRFSTSSQEFQDARDKLIRHPLFGWVVAFNVQNLNSTVSGKIIAQKYGYKRKDVDTLEDAIVFLKQVDPTINKILKTGGR